MSEGESKEELLPVEPIVLWTHYKPGEVNNAYWAAAKKLIVPGILARVFLASTLVTLFWIANAGPDRLDYSKIATADMAGLILLAAPAVIPVVATALAYLLMRMRAMASYERRPNFHAPLSFLVQRSGLELQSQTGRGVMSWQEFPVAFESGESFVIGADADEMFVLPKRCFSSTAEIIHVRRILQAENKSFKQIGKVVADDQIVFEKRAIQAILIDGVEYFFPVAEGDGANNAAPLIPPANHGTDANLPTPANSATPANAVTPVNPDALAGSDNADSSTSLGSRDNAVAPPVVNGTNSNNALLIDVIYQPDELKRAEKIYFFRKRLPAFALVYTKRAVLLALWALFVESIRAHSGANDSASVLAVAAPLFWLFIPAAVIHAAVAYRAASREISQDSFLSRTFAFQLAENFFGLTVGDKYSVLTWSNFQECWESEESFILIFGKNGRAMWVLPKRTLNRMQLAYVGDLLRNNVHPYKLLY
jgi:hypothetical protein